MIFEVSLWIILLQLVAVSSSKLILATRTANISIKHTPTAFGSHPYGRLVNGRLFYTKDICSIDKQAFETNAYVLVDFEDCSIYRQAMVLLASKAAGLIIINEKDRSLNQSIPDGFDPKDLTIPIIQVDKKAGGQLRKALQKEPRGKSDRPVLRYALRIKRTAEPKVELVLGATDKPSFDLLLSIPPYLMELNPQLYFFIEGCNECSKETIKKYCIESTSEDFCYRHPYSHLKKVADAVLLHRVLLEEYGSAQLYTKFAQHWVPSCFAWLKVDEKESSHDLFDCLLAAVEDSESKQFTSKILKSLKNQSLFGNALLSKDKAFLADKLDRGLVQIWLNGQLLQGQQSARTLEEAYCASKLQKSDVCSLIRKRSQPLHKLIAFKRSQQRRSKMRRLFRFCLAICALGAVLYFCLRFLKRRQTPAQQPSIQHVGLEEEDLNSSSRAVDSVELA